MDSQECSGEVQEIDEGSLQVALGICANPDTFSDASGMSNQDKWRCVVAVFQCPECSLFSDFSFDEAYDTDHPAIAEAAWYAADLKAQFYAREVEQRPTDISAHRAFLENRQWSTRFRERVALGRLNAPRARLT